MILNHQLCWQKLRMNLKKKKKIFLESPLAIWSEDFQTVKNIEEEKTRKLFKSIVGPAEGFIGNNQVTIQGWNVDNNKTDQTISLPANAKAAVSDIVKNLIERNNEEVPISKNIINNKGRKKDKSEWYFNGRFARRYVHRTILTI